MELLNESLLMSCQSGAVEKKGGSVVHCGLRNV